MFRWRLKQSLKVAHLTDLHLRRWGRREETLLRLLEEQKPDLIVITGDTSSPGVTDADRYPLLSKLQAPLGVYCRSRQLGAVGSHGG